MTKRFKASYVKQYHETIENKYPDLLDDWAKFVETVSKNPSKYNKTYIDHSTKTIHSTFSESRWYRSQDFEKDLMNYFK